MEPILADIIERAGRSNSDLLQALERLQMSERVNDQLTIATAMRALARCRDVDGLSPSARRDVQSAYRMCRAAMGLEP